MEPRRHHHPPWLLQFLQVSGWAQSCGLGLKVGVMGPAQWGQGRQGFRLLKKSLLIWKLMAVVLVALLFCEFLIYYLVIFRCAWPEVVVPAPGREQVPVLRAMVLADTHLLGAVQGHWLDKLRR